MTTHTPLLCFSKLLYVKDLNIHKAELQALMFSTYTLPHHHKLVRPCELPEEGSRKFHDGLYRVGINTLVASFAS